MTTKIHQAVDGRGRPLAIVVTGGQRHDAPILTEALADICVPRVGAGRPRTRLLRSSRSRQCEERQYAFNREVRVAPAARASVSRGGRLRRVEVERFDKHLQQLLSSFVAPRKYTETQTPGGIPVTARLVWAIDGEDWQVGSVTAWTPHLVLVHLSMEQRLQTLGAWLGFQIGGRAIWRVDPDDLTEFISREKTRALERLGRAHQRG